MTGLLEPPPALHSLCEFTWVPGSQTFSLSQWRVSHGKGVAFVLEHPRVSVDLIPVCSLYLSVCSCLFVDLYTGPIPTDKALTKNPN